MPTRKTLDISHEQLTDHDIEAVPPQPPLLDTHLQVPNLVPVGAARPGLRERGLAYAQLAQHGNRGAARRALELLQQAERAGSDDYELHNQLGYLLQVAGSTEAAGKEYESALRERPQDTTAAANLAVLDAELGKSADALRLLRQTFAEDPSQTAPALNLAFFDCRLGHKADALAIIHKALSFNPDSPDGRTFLATGAYNGQTCALR
jgi:Flp pilus assembly protein TadD